MTEIEKSQDYLINKWLKTYEPINEIAKVYDIHNESLSDDIKNLALQRTGFENLPLKYITDKGWHRRYQYMLFLKSESEIDKQRLTNLAWLDDFSDWLEEKKRNKKFPELGDNRKIKDVNCANALTYEESEDGSVSVYAIQLYFNIKKG